MTTVPPDPRPVSVRALRDLGGRVRLHAERLSEESLSRPAIDYRKAIAIRQVLVAIIEQAAEITAEQRDRVAEAARYFNLTDDDADDFGPGGLDDDAALVRQLCLDLGRDDLVAKLD